MKYRDLIGIFPDSTNITLFVDSVYFGCEELTSLHFRQLKNCEITRMQASGDGLLTIEISTLDLEA